ncbi:sn-glycerol-3-phosphate ABC transporter ATP-binding protein UgpC [Kushneria aurantia]|uniref:Sn-glycerol-3-phosphate ABC transporter ATP-binding protein UgpC n=1 Tax=Kushneria aurantia TaxID=504092 RepID=A0ABV6G3N4_9GAMM|nr:sn-glycerol-3-phosphate ABC transporter ATP-binding protein UgpC [Kushneria aurantia]
MSTLTLERLNKTYGGNVQAVRGVDLDIADGELIVVVGPSGCGKSTLLRLIAGLEEISDGELCIDGQRVNDSEPAGRDIAMVFQNYALYPHMSVYDNMAYSLKNRRTPKEEIRRRVTETARLLAIDDLLERRPRQLSGGQRQRVAMGRAVVRQPKVFLFDEPLSNLDASLRVQMRQEIRRLQKRLGVTSVYVTHDQVEAMTLADRLVVMNGGRIEQIGTPMTLFNQPATRFVAGFIGSPAMNFIDLAHAEQTPWLPASTPGGALTAGIRPEHLQLVTAGSGDLPGRIEMVEPLGSESLVHVRLGEHDPLLVVRLSGDELPAAEQPTGVAINGPVHLFDSDGRRLP